MAFEFDRRAKILMGVVVLAAVGAGTWFFFLDEFLNPPPPAKVAAKAPAKPAAAAKAAPDAAKPAAAAPKPAAEAAKPATAKPIPTGPDRLIAEIIEISGLKAHIQSFGREVGRSATAASQSGQAQVSAEEMKAVHEIAARLFEADKMTAEIASNLKTAYDADRMTRFLEILRQPVALKMTAHETRSTTPEETARLLEDIRKNPPSAARQKLIQTLDELTQSSEYGVQIATLTAREMVDALFTGMQKAGKTVPKQARQLAGTQIIAAQGAMRSGFRTKMYVTYRDASDEELAEYVKLLDTDTGRWGLERLSAATRSATESRARGFAREMAQLALQKVMVAKAPAVQPAVATAEEKPAEKLATAAPATAPAAEPVGYKRAANTRELYTRYNDLITATVMRDRAAVNELLEDGKYANVRQKDGMTPLMIAAANGDTEVANMLLAKGADPNLRATGGTTALSLARERGKADMVRLLQSKGAKN